MSPRVYNRLANILILIGIASALLFDSGKVPHTVAGTIGIVTGVAAMVLYFWNQHQVETKEKASAEAESPVEIVPSCGVSFKVNEAVKLRDTVDVWKRMALETKLHMYAIEAYRREAASLWLSHYAANNARTLRWHVPKDASVALMQPEVEFSPNEVAACAIEIIQNLSMADGGMEWEYLLSPKGLRVSVKKAHSLRPPQENFDFEPISFSVQ